MLIDNGVIPYLTGENRFWAEWDRYTYTHEKVSIHWFKKLCKRCGLSSREMRTVLHADGRIEKRDMPCKILKRATKYYPYEAWQYLGFQVRKGEKSYYRNYDGLAVFSNNQVAPRIKCSGEFL